MKQSRIFSSTYLTGSEILAVDEPILMAIVQVFQVFKRNAAFFVSGTLLDSFVSHFRARSQINDEVTINFVMLVDELVPFLL